MGKNLTKLCGMVGTLLLPITAMVVLAAEPVVGALPPKYLEVKDFQRCLADKNMGASTAWCLPAKKPATCPRESWHQLRRLSGEDKIPRC
ncbi:hypothetical protein [uncultured Thiodictyon sp.]|uniref:hypothetical protein n=1 Tax=uncultured Thiodictyon sp. TaxID=1846217 RepID=UPI00341302E0